MSREIRSVLAWALAALLCAIRASAQPASESAREALARPLSPGAVALLLPHAADPEVVKKLSEALDHQRADVRAVAARVAFVTRHPQLLPALQAALAQEADPIAGAELVRAVTLISDAQADGDTLKAAGRLGADAVEAWVRAASRVRSADLVTRWRGVSVPEHAARFAPALLSRIAVEPDSTVSAIAAARDTPAGLATASVLLATARVESRALPERLLRMGLEAPAPSSFQRLVLVHLLLAGIAEQHVPRYVRDWLASAPASADATTTVLRELLLRRVAGTRRPMQLDTHFDGLELEALPADFWRTRVLGDLSPEERQELSRIAGARMPPASGSLDGKDLSHALETAATGSPFGDGWRRPDRMAGVTWLVDVGLPGVVMDLTRLVACQPGSAELHVAALAYRPSGQLRRLTPLRGGGSQACGRAGQLLMQLVVAPGWEPVSESRTDLAAVSLRPEAVACAAHKTAPSAAPMRVGGAVKMPMQTRNVPAVYPGELAARRLGGLVTMDALIAATGCVGQVEVVRGVDPVLDVSALFAASAWEYAPTLHGGRAVPILATVIVRFQPPP